MSDKDLIKRRDTEEARDELVQVLNYINSSGTLDYADYCELFNTIERVFDALKAVPHEMSAVEYLKAEQRMCFDENVGKRNCSNCPLSSRINPARLNCGDYTRQHPEKAVAIVEKWAREHSEERSEE